MDTFAFKVTTCEILHLQSINLNMLPNLAFCLPKLEIV